MVIPKILYSIVFLDYTINYTLQILIKEEPYLLRSTTEYIVYTFFKLYKVNLIYNFSLVYIPSP